MIKQKGSSPLIIVTVHLLLSPAHHNMPCVDQQSPVVFILVVTSYLPLVPFHCSSLFIPDLFCSMFFRTLWRSYSATRPTSMRGTRTGRHHYTSPQPTTLSSVPTTSSPCSAVSTCLTELDARVYTTPPSTVT